MNPKTLLVFATSIAIATSAIVSPSPSIAEDVKAVDNPPANTSNPEANGTTNPTEESAATEAAPEEEIQTRGSRSHRRFRPSAQQNRPPRSNEINNAGNRNSPLRQILWF
jgi:hypothetical protein